MNHEPLRQPPNPVDLDRFPPRSPACANVRGLLRDVADGDAEAPEQQFVAEHVHTCRDCALALSRAEHEVLRLRRGFTGAGNGTVAPEPGFAGRVVARLVLDETAMLSRAVLDALRGEDPRAGAASDSGGGPGAGGGSGAGGGPWARDRAVAPSHRGERSPRTSLRGLMLALSASVLLLAGMFALVWGGDGGIEPQTDARLVVTSAAEAFARSEAGRKALAAGQGLGENELLAVGASGRAEVEWHDRSRGLQPAARLALGGRTRVRMQDGAPLVLRGELSIASQRPIQVPLADGSQVELGVGEYRLTVEAQGEDLERAASEAALWQAAPADLLVGIEVLRGDSATVVQRAGSTIVAAGSIGIYQGESGVTVSPSQGGSVGESSPTARTAGPSSSLPRLVLTGSVLDPNGLGAAGVGLLVSQITDGQVRTSNLTSAFDGSFSLQWPAAPSGLGHGNFAIVYAVPPATRPELGLQAPAAFPLVRFHNEARLEAPLALAYSEPLIGRVVDHNEQPANGVRVVPCIVDELFGSVLVWSDGQTTTDAMGAYRIRRLPVRLPPHQHLALFVLHPEFEPRVAAVPSRDDAAARAALPRIELSRRRAVTLRDLEPDTRYTLFEVVPGVGRGLAVWQQTVRSDGGGRVEELRVGSSDLWLQSSGSAFVRPLMSHASSSWIYRPVDALRLLDTVFPEFVPVPGTGLLVASAIRHADLAPEVFGGGSPVVFLDGGTGRQATGVEVFAVSPDGPYRNARVRFAGIANDGVAAVQDLGSSAHLFALAPSGACAWVSGEEVASGANVLTLQAPGRVLLDESLRPALASHEELVEVRFERSEPTVPGLSPVAIRFACAANGWEVGGLPPGSYRAIVLGRTISIDVPSGGFATLQ